MSLLGHLDIASPASYAVAVLLPALDAVMPILPSETVVITLGVATAGSADPRIALLVVLSAAGAWAGDNACYWLGRRYAGFIDRRIFSGPRGARRQAWAQDMLARHGAALVVGCRFLPGGRTAVMLTCGATGYSRRRFMVATAVAGGLWASYAIALGRVGGSTFEDRPWAGLVLALGVGTGATMVIEGARRVLAWYRARGSERSGVASPSRLHTSWTPAPTGCRSMAAVETNQGGPMDAMAIRQCPFCELRFPNRNILEAHLRDDHPNRVDLDSHVSGAGPAARVREARASWS